MLRGNPFEAVRPVWDTFLSMCTICVVFWTLVGARCHTVGEEIVDPLAKIVTRLVGGISLDRW